MNLTKKSKVTAIITVSIMLVAIVATACLLVTHNGGAAPSLYDNLDGVTSSNTAIGDSNLGLKISEASYTTSNASVAYINTTGSNGRGGYVKVLYPNAIYLDKSESLSDAGYYFGYESYCYTNNATGVNPSNHSNGIFDNIFGYYKDGYHNANPTGNAYTMHNVFNAYGAIAYNVVTEKGSVSPQDLEKNGNKNYGIKALAGEHTKNSVGVTIGIQIPLTGTIKDEYKNSAAANSGVSSANPTAKFEAQTGFTLAFSEWYGNWVAGTTQNWTALTAATTFSNGGVEGEVVGLDGKVTYASGVAMNIVIYDKSELLATIKKFTDQAAFLESLSGDSVAYDRGQAWIKAGGQAAYLKAKTVFNSREVSQKDIDDAAAALNAYVFELSKVKESEVQNLNKIYDNDAIYKADIKTFSGWSRFDTTYFDIQFLYVNETGSTTTYNPVDYINRVGTFVIQVRPKSETIMVNGVPWQFKWALDGDGDAYEYMDIGTLMVGNVKLVVSNVLTNVDLYYKNSNYDITFATVAPGVSYDGSGTATDATNRNTYFTNLYDGNAATVKLSTDGVNYNNNLVQLKDVGDTVVYYEVSSDPNYDPAYGQFTVSIKPAQLTLSFQEITQTYGNPMMDSATLVATTKISCEANSSENSDWANTVLGQIFTFRVASSGVEYNGSQYLEVGSYDVLAVVNSDWLDRVSSNISYKKLDDSDRNSNEGVYVVKAKSVFLSWTKLTSYYDGMTNHRSEAEVVESSLALIDQGRITVKAVVTLDGGLGSVTEAREEAYQVLVNLDNKNYVPADGEVERGAFKILPRPITVNLVNRTRNYGESTVASDSWANYLRRFNTTQDDIEIFTTAFTTTFSDDLLPLAGNMASDVFKVSIDTNADDYTAGDSALPEFVADNRYFKANTNGYALNIECINSNFTLSNLSSGALLIVNYANIVYDRQQFDSLTYNGDGQEVKIDTSRIALKGYEAANFAALLGQENGIKIEYKVVAPSNYATDYATTLKLTQAGDYTIGYRISAPNHNTLEYSLTQTINRAYVYIDFTPYDEDHNDGGAYYGDAIPGSNDLKDLLQVKFYADREGTKQLSTEDNFANEISIRLLDGSGSGGTLSSDEKVPTTGKYDASYVINAVSDNYYIGYTQRNGVNSNVGVYQIRKKNITLTWTTQGSGWEGNKFTYANSVPSVKASVSADQLVGEDEINPADVLWFRPDETVFEIENSISPTNVGKYIAVTYLSIQHNRENYNLTNDHVTYEIVARQIQIIVKNQTALYGNASTVPLGTALIKPSSSDALWAYASGSLEFIGEDYNNFKLISDAQNPASGEDYVDAGEYDIEVTPIYATSDAAKNYVVTVVDGGDGFNGKFTIDPTTIHYNRRQFNIQYDFAEDAVNSEKNYITQTQIRSGIEAISDKDLAEFVIYMTDLIAWTIDLNSVTGEYGENYGWTVKAQTEAATAVGMYYLFVKIEHPTNYKTFYAKIEVNIQTDWISITIKGDGIRADYGETTHSSSAIYDAIKDQITYIGGIIDDNTHQEALLPEAKRIFEKYLTDGDIEFFVGEGDTITQMTQNKDYGDYTIFIRVLNSDIGVYFRFLDEDNKSGTNKNTTNINIYHVGKRMVQMNWGVDGSMDEVYGEHGDASPSHKYSVKNPIGEDVVRVTVTYYQKVGNNWVELTDHARNVGSYLARVTAVSNDNYVIPTEETDGYWLECPFEITALQLKITINDRSDLTYGANYAQATNINTYLNIPVDGIERYYIQDMSGAPLQTFAYSDSVGDVFRFVLADYELGSGYKYLHAGDYTITYDRSFSNPNYDLEIVDGTFTIKTASKDDVRYSGAQVDSVTYKGSEYSIVEEMDILNKLTLLGDGTALLNAYKAIEFSYKLSGETDFRDDVAFKNAGTYEFDIKVKAPDHEEAVIEAIRLVVSQAQVIISMDQTSKVYGDKLQDMLAKAGMDANSSLSDWLYKTCNIKFTYSGTIEGIYDDFEFIVIDSDRDPDSLSGIRELEPGTSHNVGEYRVYVNIDKLNNNYVFDFAPSANDGNFKCNAHAYRIDPRDASVIWKSSDSDIVTSGNYKPVYTGNTVALYAYVMDLAANQERALEVEGRESDAGSYVAKVYLDKTNADNTWMNNYNFTGDTFNYVIVARDIRITIHNASVTYGGYDSKVSDWADVNDVNKFTSDVALIGTPIRLNLSNPTTGKEYLAVNTYTIVGRCDSKNYNVVEFKSGTLTVGAANINTDDERTHEQPYNGGSYTADVKQLLIDHKFYTLAGDMTWNDVQITTSDATITGVTSKEITYTIKLANHVDIVGSITVTITKAALYIGVVKGASSVYGDALLTSAQLFRYASLDTELSSLKDVKLENIIKLTINVTGDKPNSGSYDLAFEWINESDKDLYNINFNSTNVTGIYEVTQKEITFKWNYTSPFVYNGYGRAVEAVFSGVIDGDDVSVDYYNNASAINAGTYIASAHGLTGADSGNYKLAASSTLEWKILPKTIDVIWTAGNFTYNGASFSSQINNMAVADTQGLVVGDTCEIGVNATEKINAGTHTATAYSKNSNYEVSAATADFKFEIKQAPVYITWSDEVLIYNGKAQAPTATIEGNQLVPSDIGNVNVIVTIENGDGISVKASGNYIAIATLDNSNYTVVESTANCAYNISPKPITFDWEGVNTQLEYIGEPQAPRPNAIGKVEGDAVEFSFDGKEENVGTGYIATVTGVISNNYVIDWDGQTADASIEFSIKPGVNGFVEEVTLPDIVSQLPWLESKPEVKFGNEDLVIKYYSDAARTKEVTNPEKAGEGKYWITVYVPETANYGEFIAEFEVEVQGDLNVAIIILGAIASVILLAGTLAVVLTANKSAKKKKQEGDAK